MERDDSETVIREEGAYGSVATRPPKRLYLQMQQEFEENVLRKEEEERQNKLKMLRSQKQPVSRSEIRLHQQKYDQILGQKKSHLRNLREGVGLTDREAYESEERQANDDLLAKKLHRSKMLAAIKKKDKQLRLKGEIVMEEKKKLKERWNFLKRRVKPFMEVFPGQTCLILKPVLFY